MYSDKQPPQIDSRACPRLVGPRWHGDVPHQKQFICKHTTRRNTPKSIAELKAPSRCCISQSQIQQDMKTMACRPVTFICSVSHHPAEQLMRSVLKKGLRINFQVLLEMYSVASCLTCMFFMVPLLLCQTRLNVKILSKRSREVPKRPVGIRESLRKALLQLFQEPLAVEIAFACARTRSNQATKAPWRI